MLYNLLAQLLGGIVGVGIAYYMNRVVDHRDQRREAEQQAQHQAEMAAIKNQYQSGK